MSYAVDKNHEEMVMKLLHYFITDKNYNPVVLHGAKDEIWLENLNSEYKIIRIVSNYIHNDEQLDYDLFKTKQIMKSIKQKTLSMKVHTLSIFLNLGDNVHFDDGKIEFNTCIKAKKMSDIIKNDYVLEAFPDINKTTSFKEDGMELFMKITSDINKKSEAEAHIAEDVFAPKKPIVTYILIALNIIIFLLMYVLGNGSQDTATLLDFGANARYFVVGFDQFYRLITYSFLHIGIMHLAFNMYALFIIGKDIESFYGKGKYLIIYFGSAICGGLLSICMSNNVSAGASGAIFGLLGSLLYFGYHYRLYLGNAMRSQIIPIIILNLFLSFLPGIDGSCHIGGLIGGVLISMACGVKYKSKKKDQINGIILSIIFVGFMVFLLFFN